MNRIPSERMEMCPYNSAHLISSERMLYHLLKCAKSYPGVELKTCPFNACHQVTAGNYTDHLMNCPDKKIVDSQRYVSKYRNIQLTQCNFWVNICFILSHVVENF